MFNLLCIILTYLSFANPFKQLSFLIVFYPLLFIHNSTKYNNIKLVIKHAWILGTIIFSSCLYWVAYPVSNYSNVPLIVSISCPILLGLYLGIYPSLFSGLLFYIKDNNWFIKGLIGGLIWSLLEYIRYNIFTGFPWINITQALVKYPIFIHPIQIIGEVLFSGLIVCIIIWSYEVKNKKLLPAVVGCIFIILIYIWGNYLYNFKIDKSRDISTIVVQGNIDQYVKWDASFQKYTLDKYIKLTNNALKNNNHKSIVVVWPETAMPFYLDNRGISTFRLLNYTRRKNLLLITGAPGYEINSSKIKYFNRAYLIYNGKIEDFYNKLHLVPFGEYIPFSNVLGFLDKIVEGPGDFSPGKSLHPLRTRNLAIGSLICYEIIFPDLVAQLVEKGADFIVNISNDAWFGNSSGPYQHLNLAIIKAIETKRFIVRATNTGISAIITPRGEVIAKIPLNREGFLTHRIYLLNNKTFFVRHHNMLKVLTIFLSLISITILKFTQGKKC